MTSGYTSSLLYAQQEILNLRNLFCFALFFVSVKTPNPIDTNDTVPGFQSNNTMQVIISSSEEPSALDCILVLQGRISSAGSYFSNYQRRGPLCSIVDAMVSHVGHINTREQASVTHSCVCSSTKAPARLMPMQTTLPSPHGNHTGFLQEPEAEI